MVKRTPLRTRGNRAYLRMCIRETRETRINAEQRLSLLKIILAHELARPEEPTEPARNCSFGPTCRCFSCGL